VVGLIVCFQTDFCNVGQYLRIVLLSMCEITFELAIHDRRSSKVWSRLSDRGFDHVEVVLRGAGRDKKQPSEIK
jgi:hypothetical protein